MRRLFIGVGFLAAGLTGALVFLGRQPGVVTGRYGRMARIGRLYARLAASGVGARARMLVAGAKGRERIDETRRLAAAKAVTDTMGQMKGAFMKLGQMMSFVSDEIPPHMQAALKSLQTAAPPMDFPLLRDTVERELGEPLERLFARFDETPLAAASIGQVHRAMLPDGREVAVKIQYPGVAEAIEADLSNVSVLYRMVGVMYPSMEPGPVVNELREHLTEELDYRSELSNLQEFGALYEGHPFIRIPTAVPERSSEHVLTSELLSGRSFDEVMALSAEERSTYGEILYRFVFGSIFGHGLFNGDPHPGNYLFGDGHIVFLDFGCTKRFDPVMLEKWRGLVLTHIAGDAEGFRKLAVELRFLRHDADVSAELLYEYFAYFYEPIDGDKPFTFTRPWNARSFRVILRPEGKFEGMQKKLNMPADFVFVNRIQWGVYSILARLEATRNWNRIHQEILADAPPATELGEQHAAWKRKKATEPSR